MKILPPPWKNVVDLFVFAGAPNARSIMSSNWRARTCARFTEDLEIITNSPKLGMTELGRVMLNEETFGKEGPLRIDV